MCRDEVMTNVLVVATVFIFLKNPVFHKLFSVYRLSAVFIRN